MPAFAPATRLGRLPPIQAAQTRLGRLTYILSGTGPATIVLVNGAGMSLEGWRSLYPAIEQLGRVFAWNRFGVKGSDPPRQRQTGAVVIAALRELLGYAGLEPPYVLVGHSLGGLFANLYARLHPAEVRALLLLEAAHPRDREVLKQHETGFARAVEKVLSLPQRMLRSNLHSEVQAIDETARELRAAGPFPPLPLAVVTGGRQPPGWLMSPAAAGARRAHQQDLARLSPHSEQVIAQASGHFPQLSEPQLVLRVLRQLLQRTHGAFSHKPP